MINFAIDESGRGCILNSLFMACIENNPTIIVKNSKILTKQQIDRIYNQLIQVHPYYIYEIKAENIDQNNINDLEIEGVKYFIKTIQDKYTDPSLKFTIIIDKFSNKLDTMNINDSRFKIVSEYKADAKYPICSAASIIAKYTRDYNLELLQSKIEFKFGSGYPADPRTRNYILHLLKETKLDDVNKSIYHIRTKWKTIDRIKIQQIQIQ